MPVTPQPAPPPRYGFRRASPFHRTLKRVPGEGPLPAKCILIGEKPGEAEARVGRPFVGPAGQYLDLCFSAANISRSEIYITNLVKEHTSYTKPTAEEIARDHDELAGEILACDPEVVGLVGGYAVEHVLMRTPEMEKTHGCPVHVNALFGGELQRDGGYICLPILHPAGALYSADVLSLILDDFLRLGQLLDGEIEPQEDKIGEQTDYRAIEADEISIMFPRPNRTCVVGIDTEGSAAKPWSIQISAEAGKGYTILARSPQSIGRLIEWLRDNRGLVTISLHHSLHDLPVFRATGLDLIKENFTIIDTMILAYLLAIEPQGLKSLCYRHAGMLQDDYDEIIGDVGRDIAMDYLRRVSSAVDAPLVEVTVKEPKRGKKNNPPPSPQLIHAWPEPQPELIRDDGSYRMKKSQGVAKLVTRIVADVEFGKRLKDGSLIDPRARWNKLSAASKAPVIDVIGEMRVPDLDDVPFERAVEYASRDADAQYRITRPLLDRVHAMGLDEACRIDHGIIPIVDRMGEVGIKLAGPEFWDRLGDKCDQMMDKAAWNVYQLTGRHINPGSGDQVADLLYSPADKGGLGLTPPRYTYGGESGEIRGSTDDKCLEELLPLAPVVEHIEDYREASKLKGTYVEPLKLMSVAGDGRARATFKLTRQVTGRITTADPMNLLSIPVRSGLGAECRYGFVASDGKVMYDADLSTVEMRTFAHLSRDPRLCEIFIKGHEAKGDDKEKWDVHIQTASEMFGAPIHAVEGYQRQAGKVVNFFIINGGTAYGLRIQMIKFRAHRKDGSRWSEDDCQQMLDTWSQIYPGARRFQRDCIAETQATGLARDPLSGRIRYLPQIWSPIPKVRAEAERCSYAHLIQTSANTILKRALMAIWDEFRAMDGVEALLPVHDELLSELPDRDDDRAIVPLIVDHAFTQTTKLCVPIEADGNFGPNWGAAH